MLKILHTYRIVIDFHSTKFNFMVVVTWSVQQFVLFWSEYFEIVIHDIEVRVLDLALRCVIVCLINHFAFKYIKCFV